MFSLILLVLTVLLLCGQRTASSTRTPGSTDAFSLVVVSNFSKDPEVFFPYEVGTITVTPDK